jgi:hypothetical protein
MTGYNSLQSGSGFGIAARLGALQMNHARQRTSLQEYLEALWGLYFRESNLIIEMRLMVKRRHSDYREEAIDTAETVTEESLVNTNLPFPPDIVIKFARARPLLISEFPNLINQLSLIRMVSCFEFFLNRSIEKILREYPGLIRDKHKRKPDPLKAQMEAIKGFSYKLSFLKENLKVNLNHLDFRELQLRELHQTRNILVHNMGIVDEGYTRNIQGAQLHEDEERPLPDDYVDDAIHALNNAVLHLKSEFLEKFCGVVD